MSFETVVIGASQGGFSALKILLAGLPKGFPAVVVIVQHRGKDSYGNILAPALQKSCVLPVIEAEDKVKTRPGHVYIAPADYHLLLERGSCSLSTDPPVIAARPSIDVLFDSAADTYGNELIGIILTGASEDGAQGLAKIKSYGGITLVQDPATASSPRMPQAALSACDVSKVLPLSEIAPYLVGLCISENRVAS